MNELLREIEEDIRRERAQKLWNSFGKVMVGISIAVVLVTVGVVIWQNERKAYATTQTTQFIKGLDRLNIEDYKGADEVFTALSEDESSAYYGLAMLRRAQTKTLSGDTKGAEKIYQALAQKGKGDSQPFADLARILSLRRSADLPAPSTDSPFYFTQNEWRAWQLVQEGKKEEAARIFASLEANKATPPSMRERASVAIQQLSPALADKASHD